MPKHKLYQFWFNAEDWRASTFIAESDLIVTGAYINLLAAAWMSDDCTLPDDVDKLCRLSLAQNSSEFAQIWSKLSTKFRRKNGRIYNEKQMDQFKKAINKYKASVKNGKKNGTQEEPKSAPNNIPKKGVEHKNTRTQEHKKVLSTYTGTSKIETDNQFEVFWESYPKKVGKKGAIRAWQKAIDSGIDHSDILAGVERGKRCQQWTRDGGQFIPHPTTWLNGEKWNDEIDGDDISETERMEGLPF